MLMVLDRLLFHGGQSADKRETPLSISKSRSEKLDALSEVLSRKGLKLTWDHPTGSSLKINEDIFGDIQFKINGKPSFIWEFKTGHFALREIPSTQESWRYQIAEEVARGLAKQGTQHSQLLLNWFAKEDNWETLAVHLTDKVEATLAFTFPYSWSLTFLYTLEGILKNKLVSLYPVAKFLQRKLLALEPDFEPTLLTMLIDYDYPWGEPEHTVTGAVYKRVVERPDLAALGRSWRNPSDPDGLIWGDTVKLKDGSNHLMGFKDAEKYCQSIGARLPSMEEFQKLAKDMGYPDKPFYKPEFLPNLRHYTFWSSSIYEKDPIYVSSYIGKSGKLKWRHLKEKDISVRCVAR